MSFDQLTDATKKREAIEFTVGKGVITLYANQLSYIQKMNISVKFKDTRDLFTPLILMSIVDQDGHHMSENQLNGLSDEVQKKLFNAALNVNKDLLSDKAPGGNPKAVKKKVKSR